MGEFEWKQRDSVELLNRVIRWVLISQGRTDAPCFIRWLPLSTGEFMPKPWSQKLAVHISTSPWVPIVGKGWWKISMGLSNLTFRFNFPTLNNRFSPLQASYCSQNSPTLSINTSAFQTVSFSHRCVHDCMCILNSFNFIAESWKFNKAAAERERKKNSCFECQEQKLYNWTARMLLHI